MIERNFISFKGYDASLANNLEFAYGWRVDMMPSCKNIVNPTEFANYADFVRLVADTLKRLRNE